MKNIYLHCQILLSCVFFGAVGIAHATQEPSVENNVLQTRQTQTLTFEEAQAEIDKLIIARQFDKAAAKAEEFATAYPNDIAMQNLRNKVAKWLFRKENKRALEMLMESNRFNFSAAEQMQQLDDATATWLADSICGSMIFLRENKRWDEFPPLCKRALAHYSIDNKKFNSSEKARSKIVHTYVIGLEKENHTQQALDLMQTELDRVDSLLAMPEPFEEIQSHAIRVLYSYDSLIPPEKQKENRRRISELVNSALAKAPSSALILKESFPPLVTQIRDATRGLEFEKAESHIELARKRMRTAVAKDASLKEDSERWSRSLLGLESQLEKQRRRSKLIGKPMKLLGTKHWVNGNAISSDSLKGKIVLLDFWAVWCGPCVKKFPHLIELHNEFKDKGLQIIGVTDRNNYQWDEEKRRPTQAGEVSVETEIHALNQFSKSHQLPFPTIMQGQEKTISNEYSVVAIPQVVLVDQQGIVRYVDTGSGPSNARKLRAAILTLLDQSQK